MINDYQTNIVYLAEGIKHYMLLAMNLLEALHREGIEIRILRHTESKKHVWARDYMPLQLSKCRFLQYRYAPDYLKKYPDYIPPYETICRGLRLKCKTTDLVIDGGNVVKYGNKIIMTDKVLRENPRYTEGYILRHLSELTGSEICLIPWDRAEMFGHADGMVRAIGHNYVLLNNYCDFDPDLRRKIRYSLIDHGILMEELHYEVPRPSRYNWAYINFLQVNCCIFVPALGITEDAQALEQIQKYYPRHKVIPVPGCQDLVRDGGALNCISWNVLGDVCKKTTIE